jgi:hypothetical protein
VGSRARAPLPGLAPRAPNQPDPALPSQGASGPPQDLGDHHTHPSTPFDRWAAVVCRHHSGGTTAEGWLGLRPPAVWAPKPTTKRERGQATQLHTTTLLALTTVTTPGCQLSSHCVWRHLQSTTAASTRNVQYASHWPSVVVLAERTCTPAQPPQASLPASASGTTRGDRAASVLRCCNIWRSVPSSSDALLTAACCAWGWGWA